jgi:hypothetical protein
MQGILNPLKLAVNNTKNLMRNNVNNLTRTATTITNTVKARTQKAYHALTGKNHVALIGGKKRSKKRRISRKKKNSRRRRNY